MGKVQCKSTKTKNMNIHEQLVNSNKKAQNWYERKITDEYKKLKDLTENKRKGTLTELTFCLNDYKKQLNRLVKWSRIVYQKPPSNYLDDRRKLAFTLRVRI